MTSRTVKGNRLGFVLLLMLSGSVVADAGWTEHASVVELTGSVQGRYLVRLDLAENQSGCRNKSVFYQDYNLPGAKEMFAIVLEAVSSGKKIRVFVTGKCELNGYSEISSVTILP